MRLCDSAACTVSIFHNNYGLIFMRSYNSSVLELISKRRIRVLIFRGIVFISSHYLVVVFIVRLNLLILMFQFVNE